MESLSKLLQQKEINLQRELIRIENCDSCGRELKTYKMQIVGGPKKGEWAEITEECSCYYSKLTVEAVTRKKINYFKDLSTINQSLVHSTLENYSPGNHSQIHALKKAIEYIENVSQNKLSRMIYYGNPGLGKSHLAVGIYKILTENLNKTALFLDLPTLKQMIKSSWTTEGDLTELELARAIGEVDVLILDDVGAEGITSWTKEILFSILNSRLSKNLVVTTNMKLADFHSQYGPKITDRFIQGMAKDDLVKMEGDYSYRLKKFIEEDG